MIEFFVKLLKAFFDAFLSFLGLIGNGITWASQSTWHAIIVLIGVVIAGIIIIGAAKLLKR